MIEVAFPNLGYDLTEESWQEQAAKAYCILIENCYQAGYKLSQAETSDLSEMETEFSELSDYLKSWHDGNVELSAAGESPAALSKSYIPELAQFAILAATGQWGLVFVLFVKVGLEFLLDKEEKQLDPDVATGDSAEILKQLFGILDEEGNIVGNRLEGLTDLSIAINNILSQGEHDALYSFTNKVE